MKNIVVAIRETETLCRYYVAIASDISTGKVYAYNPDTGYKVITPYKDRDALQTAYIRRHPFGWMKTFDCQAVDVPNGWTD